MTAAGGFCAARHHTFTTAVVACIFLLLKMKITLVLKVKTALSPCF